MRFLDDGFYACPQCEGYGVDLRSDDTNDCPSCEGTGVLPINGYIWIEQSRPYRIKHTIWSPLLCDPETIRRMSTIELEARQ